MNKWIHIIIFLFLLVSIYNCAHTVPVEVSPVYDFQSDYDNKIPGAIVLVIDQNVKNIHKDMKPSSYECSAHTFSLDIRDELARSISQTTESIFEEVIERNELPKREELLQLNCHGSIYIKMRRFAPKLRFAGGAVISNCDITIDVTVRDVEGRKLMGRSFSGYRIADGSSGGFCEGGEDVINEAMSEAMRDTLERYAEKISDSSKIRESFSH